MNNQLQFLKESLFSDNVVKQRTTSNAIAIREQEDQDTLEVSFAANIPTFPLSDPFVQAANYKDTVYLAIQHLMQAMSGCVAALEKKTSGKKSIASGGAQFSDQGYEPITDHPLCDILQQPNPADTFVDFVLQCILNWNLHGDILIWARPNNVGAPIRFYCLPVPLCQPAFQLGTTEYPFGAWNIQQYYPNSGIAGIIPNGLTGHAGTYIDSRQVYRMKNPHPVFRWASFSPLIGGDSAVDIIRNIDLSFWSIMSQGPKPAGLIDLPGADETQIRKVQQKVDNAHGGARKHGKPIVTGGGDPERPGITWTPIQSLTPEALHEGGWEIFTGFVLALFGLDMAGVGLRRQGNHAERWAARRDERDTLTTFLNRLASTLTQGGLVKQWGLLKQGVRIAIHLPEQMGYEPSEMSRDMSGDGTGTYNEVRRLRGFKGAEGMLEEYGKYPVAIALKLMEKKLGIDDTSSQKELADQQSKLNPAPAPGEEGSAGPGGNETHANSPSKTEPGGAGSLGGKTNVKAKDALGHGSDKGPGTMLSHDQATKELDALERKESKNDPGVKFKGQNDAGSFKGRKEHCEKYVALYEDLKARSPKALHFSIDRNIRHLQSMMTKAIPEALAERGLMVLPSPENGTIPNLQSLVERILQSPVLLNGDH